MAHSVCVVNTEAAEEEGPLVSRDGRGGWRLDGAHVAGWLRTGQDCFGSQDGFFSRWRWLIMRFSRDGLRCRSAVRGDVCDVGVIEIDVACEVVVDIADPDVSAEELREWCFWEGERNRRPSFTDCALCGILDAGAGCCPDTVVLLKRRFSRFRFGGGVGLCASSKPASVLSDRAR